MLPEDAAAELCRQLNASPQLVNASIDAECPARKMVVVSRRGSVLGIWLIRTEQFDWVPGGYSEPVYRANSVNEAVAYTMTTLVSR